MLANLSGHGHEGLLDVGVGLSGGFKERNTKLIRESLGSFVVDLATVHLIALVTNKELGDVGAGIAVNLREPNLDVVEGLSLSDIVHDDDTVSTTVVSGGDGAETILTGSIPEL